ncbi:MAG: serine/threonine-protein phosphatase [Verrucomicrobiales bacterium]|nr:serine/threonine-protein phosphatase [Verrucomicrobiales bacterium]
MPDDENILPESLGRTHATSQGEVWLHWSARTDCGRFRKNNEDSFLALTVNGWEVARLGSYGEMKLERRDCLFAVSDGMGGQNSGEFASRIAVDNITRLIPRTFRAGAEGMPTGFADVLMELFHRIHSEMERYSRVYEECRNMGATLSLAWFAPGWMFFGHIGDSRIYYLPAEGGLRQITQDDTHVGWLRREGKINEREHRTHPRRNSLAKALGAGHRYVDPQIGAVSCVAGDRFLICSDGVVDGLWDRAIEDHMRSPRPATAGLLPAERLVREALEGGSRDNTTALVIEVRDGPSDQPAE